MSSSLRARVAWTLTLAAVTGVAICFALAEVTVNPRILQLDAFEVMGIAVRTNNANEASAGGAIPKLWRRVMQEHALNTVPDPVDQNIYAVYSDYASDANGDYTLVLGKRVPSGAKLEDGFLVKTVPAGRYAVFTSDRGPVAKVVVETWKEIWSYYQSPTNGQRAYRADFELYDQRAADPNNAQVDIYIGVK
jgi:predicted transcriptional regulator YdeE